MANPRDSDYQMKYLLSKADKLYQKGDHEGALMFYSKGARMYPGHKELNNGVVKCERALDRNNPGRWKGPNHDDHGNKEPDEDMYDPRGAMGNDSPTINQPPPQPLPKPPKPKNGVRLKPEDYPHLTRKELWLLQQGMTLFKNKEFDLALQHYETGNESNPSAEEFQFGMFLCEGKLKKEAERKEELLKNMPPPKAMTPPDSDSRSKSVRELEDKFTHRFTFLLNQAKACYAKGDFQGAYLFADKGEQLMPGSVNFKRTKNEAQEGLEIALGAKEPSQDLIQKYVLMEIVKAQHLMNDGKYEESIEQCQKTLESVAEMYKEAIEDKPTLMATCYSIAGNCYIELNNNSKALAYHLKDLEVGNTHNLEDVKARALVNVGTVYARMENYPKAIQLWTDYINFNYNMSHEHKSWTYHEIGYCYLECEDLQNAFKYAEFSLNSAIRAKLPGRKYKAAVLFGRIALRSSELEVARTSFERAIEFAEEANDPEGKQRIVEAIAGIDEVVRELKEEERKKRDF